MTHRDRDDNTGGSSLKASSEKSDPRLGAARTTDASDPSKTGVSVAKTDEADADSNTPQAQARPGVRKKTPSFDSSVSSEKHRAPASQTAAPPGPPDPLAAQAVQQARQALLEDVDAAMVGQHRSVVADGPGVVSHQFECTDFAYRGWYWSVTLARVPHAKRCTVSEVALLPGPQALLPPPWVPWSQRLHPGDVGVGDLLPTTQSDERLVPGFFPVDDTGGDASTPPAPQVRQSPHFSLAPAEHTPGHHGPGLFSDDVPSSDVSSSDVPNTELLAWDQQLSVRTSWQLGLGKTRVLSPAGRQQVAQRWYEGPGGPHAPCAEVAPAQCSTCGFFLPLAGAFTQAFGVCANEYSPSESHVVSVDHGCGAHSEIAVVPKTRSAQLVVDQYAYDSIDLHVQQDEVGQPGEEGSSETTPVAHSADSDGEVNPEDVTVEEASVSAVKAKRFSRRRQ